MTEFAAPLPTGVDGKELTSRGAATRGRLLEAAENVFADLGYTVSPRWDEPRTDIIHRCVVWQLAKRQRGTHEVKNRADITRTGTAKGLFTVKIATGAKSDVATLLGRLGGAPLADRSLV